jgi:hypothetical protein
MFNATLYDVRPAGENFVEVTVLPFMEKTEKFMVLPMNETEFLECYRLWQLDGLLIQQAFPMLNEDQREFLLTGMTADEWDNLFKEDV